MPRPLGNERIKCSECNLRLARYASGMCFRCHFRTSAEGTRKTRQELKKEQWREEASRYNKLVAKGLTQKQIAAELGIGADSLRGKVYRWKRGGVAVAYAGRSGSKSKPVPTKTFRSRKNPHGGGKAGRGGCMCEPCVAKRKQNRAQYYQETGR